MPKPYSAYAWLRRLRKVRRVMRQRIVLGSASVRRSGGWGNLRVEAALSQNPVEAALRA
jgi:hypothetical protein